MASLPERSGVVRDPATGEMIIPASQRPDGTWRKARRVKDGYIPQEEMPAFQTKGNHFTKTKPDHPIGLSKSDVEKIKKVKDAQIEANTNAAVRAKSGKAKDKQPQTQKPKAKKQVKAVESITKDVACVRLASESAAPAELTQEDIVKKIRNLRKKLRQIEELELKFSSGDLNEVNKEQLDKISKKKSVEDEIKDLESKVNI